MATPEKWLRSAIVGATTAGVYPVMAPQNASLPIVVYRRSGTTRSRNIQSQTGMPVATFSVATVSESYTEAKTIGEAVRLALDNFTGDVSGVKIVTVAIVSESDNMESPLEGRDKPLYRVDQVYEVRFEELIQ